MTSNADIADLTARIEALDDKDLERLAKSMLTEIDPNPALLAEEVETRIDADRELLRELSRLQDVEPAPSPDVRAALVEVAVQVPDLVPSMEAALDSVEQENVTLDFGLSLGLAVIVVALAGAILRPRVETHHERIDDPQGASVDRSSTIVEVRGVNDVGKLLKSVLPFL